MLEVYRREKNKTERVQGPALKGINKGGDVHYCSLNSHTLACNCGSVVADGEDALYHGDRRSLGMVHFH